MPHLRYLGSARKDLLQIQTYIRRESGSAGVARGFMDRLRGKCVQLASLPGTMGRDRSELESGLRSSVFRGYVIYFRYAGDELQIVNILEGRRDAEQHFGDEA